MYDKMTIVNVIETTENVVAIIEASRSL